MIRTLGLAGVVWVVTASAVSAQTPAAAPATDTAVADSTTQNAVTKYSIKSGKLALSSAAHPGLTFLPDGTYTNQADLIIVILDGHITRIQDGSGPITEINSIRLTRQQAVALMPATSGLMAVREIPLPSGTFTSADGKNSFTIVYGKPTEFTLGGS
jgi:hypothetical protein